MTIKTKFKMIDISSLVLSLLIVSINLREPFFHTREILYVLTIITSLKLMDMRKAKYAFTLILIWNISVFYNLIVPGSNIDLNNGGFETVIISAYLLLMCFYQERYAKVLIKSYNFVSVVVALIVVSIWSICYMSDLAYYSLRTYFMNLYKFTELTLINIDKRVILGVEFLTVWYRTSPCMVCTLGYYLSMRLEGKSENTLKIILLSLGLFFSGTRANIISVGLLIGAYIGFKLYKKGFRLVSLFLISAGLIICIIFIIMFAQDSGSKSSSIKMLDLMTYIDVYAEDPIRTFFFGWAPGSSFFSGGRQEFVNVTELSLFETIRRYGLISTCAIIFGIWFTPFRSSNFKRIKHIKYFYYCIFGAYMLSAFSNPYLLDSVGFSALLFFCVFFKYGIET